MKYEIEKRAFLVEKFNKFKNFIHLVKYKFIKIVTKILKKVCQTCTYFVDLIELNPNIPLLTYNSF